MCHRGCYCPPETHGCIGLPPPGLCKRLCRDINHCDVNCACPPTMKCDRGRCKVTTKEGVAGVPLEMLHGTAWALLHCAEGAALKTVPALGAQCKHGEVGTNLASWMRCRACAPVAVSAPWETA